MQILLLFFYGMTWLKAQKHLNEIYVFIIWNLLPPLSRLCDQIKIHDKLSLPMDHLQSAQTLLMIISLHAYGGFTHADPRQNKLQQELC